MTKFPFQIRYFLIPIFIFCFGLSSYAQDDIEKEFPTQKIRRKAKDNRSKNQPKVKSIAYIYKKDTKKILYGNPCALDVTRKWGFEYAVEHREKVSLKRAFFRSYNNSKIKLRLFLTKGPWWKLVIKKRFKKCSRITGDTTG